MKKEEILEMLTELKNRLPEDFTVEDIVKAAQRREREIGGFVLVTQKYLEIED